MRAQQASRFVFAFVMILMSASVHAQVLNNEVEFYGTISDVALKGDAEGTAFVDIGGFDLRVIVNPKTELMDSGKGPITLDSLAGLKDPIVLVSGKFSSSGVLATKIEVVGTEKNTFEVSGHITAIQPGTPTVISLLGLTIRATTAPDGLKIGDWVSIKGTINDGTWTAASVNLVDPGKKKGTLHFEGVVDSWTPGKGLLEVLVTGATGDATDVHVTSETRVTGELTKGAYVAVKGKLVNFEVQASQVEVIGPFEIKPDERKLKVGETAEFTIKLREVAPAAGVSVTIAVESTPQGVLSPTSSTFKIPAGERTGSFSVKADKEGSATITATALGSSQTADVAVGSMSEIDNERPTGDVRIAFAPGHIKMGPSDSREVVLIVQPPQQGTVTFEIEPTNAGLKVSESPDHDLGQGAARMKVLITSSDNPPDSAKITARLGTAKAELLVDLTAKGKKQ